MRSIEFCKYFEILDGYVNVFMRHHKSTNDAKSSLHLGSYAIFWSPSINLLQKFLQSPKRIQVAFACKTSWKNSVKIFRKFIEECTLTAHEKNDRFSKYLCEMRNAFFVDEI